MNKPLLAAVLAAFSALTLWVIAQVGFWNLWVYNLNHPAGVQVFTDLGIALGLFCVWMWRDARTLQRSWWAWMIFTFAVGSFGPLLYLLTRRERAPT